MSEPAGHDAGFWLNVTSGQACWIVVSREGSALGSVTATLPMFACPGAEPTLTSRLAPFFLLVFACVETVNVGLNGSSLHPLAWKRLETFALAPCVEVTAPVSAIGVQFVGLNVNPGRSKVPPPRLIRSGIPSRIVGNGSDTSVTCAVCGSIRSDWRTPAVPRLNGRATVGAATPRP